jgi:hypothetical protein
MESLNEILKENKFSAFNNYCAGEPMILGTIEKEKSSLGKESSDNLFARCQPLWISLNQN